jgi:Flp pilus assembly protein TadD
MRANKLPIVESFHFNSDIEELRAGITGTVIDELDYTLRAFPNHYRALQSLSRYALSGGKFKSATIPSAECYFERAVAFAPDDEIVRIIYGNLLFKRHMLVQAREQYERATQLAPDSPQISYNAGLFFVEVGDLDKAAKLAAVAYGADYPLPGLKNKLHAAQLEAAGKQPSKLK